MKITEDGQFQSMVSATARLWLIWQMKHQMKMKNITHLIVRKNVRKCSKETLFDPFPLPRGGHSHIMELLMLVNQPQKWTLNGVIGKGWFATLNGVTLHISNPKWRNKPKSYPKWRIGQNLTLNGVLTNILYKRCNETRHHRCHWQHHQHQSPFSSPTS